MTIEERQTPAPHKRFRIEGSGASLGSHVDVAVTPDMNGACLHIFDSGEAVTGKMYFSVEGGKRFPIRLCETCRKAVSAAKN